MQVCEKCGKELFVKYGSGRFCSRSCANSRNITSEQKEKISKSVKLTADKHKEKVCEKCGNSFVSKDSSRKQCFVCLPKTIKYASSTKQVNSILDLSSRTISKLLIRINLPCTCCGFHVDGVVLDLHHIVPKKQGGTNDLTNLTYICPNCHRLAHTNISLLQKPLISFYDYLQKNNIDWKSYYYIK